MSRNLEPSCVLSETFSNIPQDWATFFYFVIQQQGGNLPFFEVALRIPTEPTCRAGMDLVREAGRLVFSVASPAISQGVRGGRATLADLPRTTRCVSRNSPPAPHPSPPRSGRP